MRASLFLVGSVTAALIAAACGGSGDGSNFTNGAVTDDGGPGMPGPFDPNGSSGTDPTGTGDPALDIEESSLRVEPADAVLTATAGKPLTQGYKIFGKTKNAGAETDLTSRFVFYVPDNYLVGGFPLDGGPLWSMRLPGTATDPAQRAGKLTVQARGRNAVGEVKVTTTLTVKLNGVLSANDNPSIPPDPQTKFSGTPDASRAPTLVYPNDGAMLPPNLRRLEVHWRPGPNKNKLFEVSFKSALAEITYYARCGGGAGFQNDSCAFELDGAGYGYVAESNKGAGEYRRVRSVF